MLSRKSTNESQMISINHMKYIYVTGDLYKKDIDHEYLNVLISACALSTIIEEGRQSFLMD